MSGDCDTAKRLIASLIQFTQPGQIDLPLNWVDGPEEPKQDIVSHIFDVNNDVNVLGGDNEIGVESTEKIVEDENLEDGELLEDEDENVEKENIQNVSSPLTSLNSLNESHNGSCSGETSLSKSAKEEARRIKFGHLMCRFFREGHCREGNACSYSHNAADSHRKPELCKGYILGTCRKALKCNLLHGEHPCKDFHFGRCNLLKCRFSHQPLDDYTRSIFEKALKHEEDAITAATANTPPIPPPFSSFQNVTVNCPANFSRQPFSKSANHIIHTNLNSLSYNKNAFRQSIAHPYIKLSKSKPISPVQNVTATADNNLLSDVAFNLPHLRQCC